MIDKADLLARISELEKEMSENGALQDQIKQRYRGQEDALKSSIAEKEEKKSRVRKKKPPFFLWLILIADLILFFICATNPDLLVLALALLAGGVGLLIVIIVLNAKAGRALRAEIAGIDREIAEIQSKIDSLYHSDKQFSTLTARYSELYREHKSAKAQLEEITFNENLGENCVYVFPTGFADRDVIGVVIDGKEMGPVPSPIGVYQLTEGAHTLYVTRNYDLTETVQFRLNGNNKFLYYKFEYYGRGYSKRTSSSFTDFVNDNALYDFTVDSIKNHIINL